jgi:hypothetical protein
MFRERMSISIMLRSQDYFEQGDICVSFGAAVLGSRSWNRSFGITRVRSAVTRYTWRMGM